MVGRTWGAKTVVLVRTLEPLVLKFMRDISIMKFPIKLPVKCSSNSHSLISKIVNHAIVNVY